MASCITSQFGNSYCPQVKLTASVTSNTNTSATISWELEWITHGYTISSSQSKSYSVKIGGTTVKSGSFAYGGKTSRTIASGTRTITKTTSSQSITCSFTFAMTFNWNGTTGKSQTKSCKVAVSAKPKYTISYNANGGSGAPSSQTKWYGTSIKLSSTKPTRTGYIFQGWGTSASGSVVYASGATYSTNASDTLYAVWRIITYTISYNANGGSGAPSSQTKNYGSSIKLSTTEPTRTNYNFKGWATSASGSVVYASGATYSSNSSITLYAVWELAYTPPSISSLKVSRCESDGTAAETGTYAKVTFSWSCSQLIGSNPVTSIVIKWGTSSQSTVSASGNSGSVSHIIGTLDVDKSYTITVVVTDSKNGSSSLSAILPTAAFYLDFKSGGSGVAIGKVAEEADLLDIGYESRFLNPAMFNAGLKEKLPVISNADMNTITESGKYYLINPPTNSPIAKSGYLEVMRYENDTSFVYQRFTTYDGNKFERICVSGTWEQWCGTFMKGIWTYTTQVNGLFEAWGTRDLGAYSSYATSVISGLYLYVHTEQLPIQLYTTGTYIKQAQVNTGETIFSTGGLNDSPKQVGAHWAAAVSSGYCSVVYHVKGYWKKPTIPIVT